MLPLTLLLLLVPALSAQFSGAEGDQLRRDRGVRGEPVFATDILTQLCETRVRAAVPLHERG